MRLRGYFLGQATPLAASIVVLLALAAITAGLTLPHEPAEFSGQGTNRQAQPVLSQRNQPPETAEHRSLGFVTIKPASEPGMMSYEDREDGFRLDYPSLLQCRQLLIFRDPPSPTMIALYLVFSSDDPKTYLQTLAHLHGSMSVQEINGITWITYRTSSGAVGYYIYRDYEAVDIEGVPSVVTKTVSEAEVQAIRKMASHFAFSDPSTRMDAKIAMLKVGDRFGKLTVSRVVTRAKANGNRKEYRENPLGEVDFRGTLTLTGTLENNQTMNSGPDYAISAFDSGSYSELPQVGYSFDFSGDDYFQIHLRNEDKVEDTLQKHKPRDEQVTILVNELKEVFYPGGGAPWVTAELLKIVD
jgi:hypothetical protein